MSHRHEELDEDKRIIPDGGSVRVSIMAMDSTQRKIASLDARVQHTIDGNAAVLAAARRNADRAQAFADHFTAQRQQATADADTPYATYCRQLSDHWRQVVA